MSAERVATIHNTAQPEQFEGMTMHPVRPVVCRMIPIKFEKFIPTGERSYEIVAELIAKWPQLRGEYNTIISSSGGIEQEFVDKEEFGSGQESFETIGINNILRCHLPPIRFERETGKIYERYTNQLSVAFSPRKDHFTVSSLMSASSKSRIASGHYYEPIAFSDTRAIVEFDRNLAQKTASWLGERTESLISGRFNELTMSRHYREYEILTLGVTDDADMERIIGRVDEMDFEFHEGRSITDVFADNNDKKRFTTYLDPIVDTTAIFNESAASFTEEKERQRNWATSDVHVKWTNGYYKMWTVPYFKQLTQNRSVQQFVGIVPEHPDLGESALRSCRIVTRSFEAPPLFSGS